MTISDDDAAVSEPAEEPVGTDVQEAPASATSVPGQAEGAGERGPERGDRRGGGPRRRGGGRGGPRRRPCPFCVDKVSFIDYKDVSRLRRYISERGRIEPRRKTGVCAKHQRSLATALKRARHIALLPYTPEHIRITGATFGPPR